MPHAAVAIIPAYNEAPRIASVISAVRSSRSVTRVLVVDDGSTDKTSHIARLAGAYTLRQSPNRGKGQAMRLGLRVTWEPIVLFLDADLIGLTPGHVQRLLEPVVQGRCVMTTGLRDYGTVWNQLQKALPRITGERVVLRSILRRVPEDFWDGFRIEAGINAVAVKTGPVCDVPLYGVSMPPKWSKEDPRIGLIHALKMTQQVLIAIRQAQFL